MHIYYNIFDTTLDAPALPSIIQIPSGPVIEGEMVVLTCEISGGNPLATINWICDGLTYMPSNINLPGKVLSRIELNATINSDGKKCICSGHHPLWADNKEEGHTLIVYCK